MPFHLIWSHASLVQKSLSFWQISNILSILSVYFQHGKIMGLQYEVELGTERKKHNCKVQTFVWQSLQMIQRNILHPIISLEWYID